MRKGDQLQGKVALITGGGGEIGGAIARQFALQGASVMLADLRPEAAAATVADIVAAGGTAARVICDVAREADAVRAVAETTASFGRLDILVNTAAAVTPDGTCETLTLDQWAQHIKAETDRNYHHFKEDPATYSHSEAFYKMLMMAPRWFCSCQAMGTSRSSK